MANIRETVDERLIRMRKLSNISEANYSLVGGIDEDDDMPDLTEPEVEEPNVEQEPDMGSETPPIEEPASNDNMNNAADDGQMGIDVAVEPEGISPEMGMEEPISQEPSVEEKQNSIIQLNISAMQKMQTVIDGLENTVNSLNGKIGTLSSDVEEVREPKNVEKLMKRKEDSHPFYYNLNDMWKGNSFQARREVDGIQGIKKMEDGSYMADFDDLPKHNSREIGQSFNLNLAENKKYKK
jgi:hypothetical protein